ncbi:MAG: phytoene/squalene synthase family protein [Pseudomonadota bacterium]
MRDTDFETCRAAIQTGSYSFYAASKLLPANIRNPAYVLYAFCRLADDAVDLTKSKSEAVLSLRDRLDRVYRGDPLDTPVDRAFAQVVKEYHMPFELPEALLEGLAWDAEGRRYQTVDDLMDYCARVASAVGAMMCVLMGVRHRDTLARACDLGLAMQLTNIARDLGEDREEGRIYVPLDWLEETGVSAEKFLRTTSATNESRGYARRLLKHADHFYRRSEAGVPALPLQARTGIFAARYIYGAIGKEIARNGFDSITQRAVTSKGTKLRLLLWSGLRAAQLSLLPQSPILHATPDPSVRFLINAASITSDTKSGWFERADALLDVLAKLEKANSHMGPK